MAFSSPASGHISPPLSSSPLACLRSVWQNHCISRAAEPLVPPFTAMNDNVRNKCPRAYSDCLQQDPCALHATRMHAHVCTCAHACIHIHVHTPVHMQTYAHMCTQCIYRHTHDAEYSGVGPIMPVGLLFLRDFPYAL